MTNKRRKKAAALMAPQVDVPDWARTSLARVKRDLEQPTGAHRSAYQYVSQALDSPRRPLAEVDVLRIEPDEAVAAFSALREEGWSTRDLLRWAMGRLTVDPAYIDLAGAAGEGPRVAFDGGSAAMRGMLIETVELAVGGRSTKALHLMPVGADVVWDGAEAFVTTTSPLNAARWATSPEAWGGAPMPSFAPVGSIVIELVERGRRPVIPTELTCELVSRIPRTAETAEFAAIPLAQLGLAMRGRAVIGYRSLRDLLGMFERPQMEAAMAITARIIVAQAALGVAALRHFTTIPVRVFEVPATDREITRSQPPSSPATGAIRVGPGRVYRSVGASAAEVGDGVPTGRRGHYHHVTRGSHVHCVECHDDPSRGKAACERCRGTGRDPDLVGPCMRRDPPTTGELTCPDGCRLEWVHEIKAPDERQTVRVLMTNRERPSSGSD